VRYLRIKRRRDLRRHRWQFAAVLVTITLGVLLFAASYDAYRNLDASYNGTYERLAFADVTITGAAPGFAQTVAGLDGVATVTSRREADVPLRVGDHAFLGRLVGMPVAHQPEIDRIDVVRGRYLDPEEPRGVVVETHMADEFHLDVGDDLAVLTPSGWTRVRVLGVAVSPEYIWPARSRQDIFPAPGSFGVLFTPAGLLDALPAAAVTDEVLVRYDATGDRPALDAAIAAQARDAGAGAVIPRAEHPSNQTLNLDVQGFAQMAVLFPLLFLLAAGMATFILLTRIVYAQRGQIGTLRASGMSRRTLSRHYLSYGLLLGTAGAVLGVLAGMAAGWGITAGYTRSLGIPDTVRGFHPLTPVVGLLFGVTTGALSGLAPARAAFRISPAEAMRGVQPPDGGRRSLFERLVPLLRRLPVRWLMVLRGIGRNRRRSLSTVIGVVLALMLILAAWGMIDTTSILVDRQFNDVHREDAVVVLAVPNVPAAADTVAAVPGVASVETTLTIPVTVRSSTADYATRIEGLVPTTRMHGFIGDVDHLPPDGVLAGRALADELGIAVGDRVEVILPTLGTSFRTQVRGFLDEPVGTLLYMDEDALTRAITEEADPPVPAARLADPTLAPLLVRFAAGVDRSAVLHDIEALPQVATVVDARRLFGLVHDYLGFFYAFVGMMLVFGGAMAFALIFNTISVNVAERAGEYATMRANGLSHRRIAALITGENLLLTLLGILPGLLIGYWTAAAMMHTYSSDLLTFDLEMHPTTLLYAAAALVVVALLSLIPGVRSVGRLDVAQVVRERSL